MRIATRNYILRSGGGILLVTFLLLCCFILFIVHNDANPITYILTGALGMYLGRMIHYYLRSDNSLKLLSDRSVSIRMDDDSITFITSERRTTIKWIGIKDVWLFKEVILLFPYGVGSPFSYIPISSMTVDTKEFFLNKIKENKKKAA